MLRRILFILFSIAILASSGKHIGYVIYYTLNKAYIVSNVCVNRFVENSTCQGKCYLKDKLENAEDSMPGSKIPMEQTTDRWQYLAELDIAGVSHVTPYCFVSEFFEDNTYWHEYESDIFHPPQC